MPESAQLLRFLVRRFAGPGGESQQEAWSKEAERLAEVIVMMMTVMMMTVMMMTEMIFMILGMIPDLHNYFQPS